MPWQNNICVTMLTANIVVPSMLDCVAPKERKPELHAPNTSYTQQIETPERLKIDALRDLSLLTKDITGAYLEVKEKHDNAKETIDRTKLPSYSYSERPPKSMDSQAKHLENSRKKTHEFFSSEYNIKLEKTSVEKVMAMDNKNKALAIERTIVFSGRINPVQTLDDEAHRQERQLRREQERAERRNRTSILERGR